MKTPPSVKLLPVSAVRFGLPADRYWMVCLRATQLMNGLPTGCAASAHGEPAWIVVGTPSAAQLAAKFGLVLIAVTVARIGDESRS